MIDEKQSAFIANISKRLNRPFPASVPARNEIGAPDFWNTFELVNEDRISQFTDNFEAAGGHVIQLANMDTAIEWMRNKAIEIGATQIVRQNDPLLESELDSRKDWTSVIWNQSEYENGTTISANSDIGIVVVDYAASYTGSLIITSSPDKGRSISLLPPVLFALLPSSRLLTRMGEVFEQVESKYGKQLPAGIHFISGPSRSADIENDLTIGVHGPGIVYAILVDDI